MRLPDEPDVEPREPAASGVPAAIDIDENPNDQSNNTGVPAVMQPDRGQAFLRPPVEVRDIEVPEAIIREQFTKPYTQEMTYVDARGVVKSGKKLRKFRYQDQVVVGIRVPDRSGAKNHKFTYIIQSHSPIQNDKALKERYYEAKTRRDAPKKLMVKFKQRKPKKVAPRRERSRSTYREGEKGSDAFQWWVHQTEVDMHIEKMRNWKLMRDRIREKYKGQPKKLKRALNKFQEIWEKAQPSKREQREFAKSLVRENEDYKEELAGDIMKNRQAASAGEEKKRKAAFAKEDKQNKEERQKRIAERQKRIQQAVLGDLEALASPSPTSTPSPSEESDPEVRAILGSLEPLPLEPRPTPSRERSLQPPDTESDDEDIGNIRKGTADMLKRSTQKFDGHKSRMRRTADGKRPRRKVNYNQDDYYDNIGVPSMSEAARRKPEDPALARHRRLPNPFIKRKPNPFLKPNITPPPRKRRQARFSSSSSVPLPRGSQVKRSMSRLPPDRPRGPIDTPEARSRSGSPVLDPGVARDLQRRQQRGETPQNRAEALHWLSKEKSREQENMESAAYWLGREREDRIAERSETPANREDASHWMDQLLGLDDEESEWRPGVDDPSYVAPRKKKKKRGRSPETMPTRFTNRPVSPARAQEIVIPHDEWDEKHDEMEVSVTPVLRRAPRVYEDVPRIGIRNVRQVQVINDMFNAPAQMIARKDPRVPITVVPGGYVAPEIQNWYYQSAFEPKPKRSWASQAYPDLFGPEGVYPLAYEEGCAPECVDELGECVC